MIIRNAKMLKILFLLSNGSRKPFVVENSCGAVQGCQCSSVPWASLGERSALNAGSNHRSSAPGAWGGGSPVLHSPRIFCAPLQRSRSVFCSAPTLQTPSPGPSTCLGAFPLLRKTHPYNPLYQWPGEKKNSTGKSSQILAGTGGRVVLGGDYTGEQQECTGDFLQKWAGSGERGRLKHSNTRRG